MRKWGKSSVVAVVALGCALFVMGVVRIGGGERGVAASPARGWQPEEPEVLRQPADQAPKPPRRTDG